MANGQHIQIRRPGEDDGRDHFCPGGKDKGEFGKWREYFACRALVISASYLRHYCFMQMFFISYGGHACLRACRCKALSLSVEINT